MTAHIYDAFYFFFFFFFFLILTSRSPPCMDRRHSEQVSEDIANSFPFYLAEGCEIESFGIFWCLKKASKTPSFSVGLKATNFTEKTLDRLDMSRQEQRGMPFCWILRMMIARARIRTVRRRPSRYWRGEGSVAVERDGAIEAVVRAYLPCRHRRPSCRRHPQRLRDCEERSLQLGRP